MCNPSDGEMGGGSLETAGLAVFHANDRPCYKQKVEGTKDVTGGDDGPLTSTGMCIYVNPPT